MTILLIQDLSYPGIFLRFALASAAKLRKHIVVWSTAPMDRPESQSRIFSMRWTGENAKELTLPVRVTEKSVRMFWDSDDSDLDPRTSGSEL